MNPFFSIIQIIHDGSKIELLERSVESIKSQTYKSFEHLIIGDSAMTGKMKEIIENNQIRFINCSEIISNDNSISEHGVKGKFSRTVKKNYGAHIASGRFLYFIDDDFLLNPKILEEAKEQVEVNQVNMISVHNTSMANSSIWSKVRKFERDMYKFENENISARIVSKELFDSINGFNENMIAGEDYDIHNRMLKAGGKLGFIESEEYHLGEPTDLLMILKEHYYYGRMLSQSLEKGTVDLTNSNSLPLRKAYLKNWKKFIINPQLSLLFIVYQSLRFISGGIGGWKYLVHFLKNKL